MGLDWMQRLGIHLNTNNSKIQIHDIKADDTGKKTSQLKNGFNVIFYKNKEIKDLSVEINLKAGAQLIQKRGRPIAIHLQDQVAKELKRLIENGYLGRATELPRSYNSKGGQTNQNSTTLTKIETMKRKTQKPNMEELISRKSRKNVRRRRRYPGNTIRLRF